MRIFVLAYRNTETTPLSLSKENTSLFSLPLKYYYYNQQTLPRTVKIIWCGGGGCSKGILEFHFGPNLGLRLEAGTKLNNNADNNSNGKTNAKALMTKTLILNKSQPFFLPQLISVFSQYLVAVFPCGAGCSIFTDV